MWRESEKRHYFSTLKLVRNKYGISFSKYDAGWCNNNNYYFITFKKIIIIIIVISKTEIYDNSNTIGTIKLNKISWKVYKLFYLVTKYISSLASVKPLSFYFGRKQQRDRFTNMSHYKSTNYLLCHSENKMHYWCTLHSQTLVKLAAWAEIEFATFTKNTGLWVAHV